MRRPGRVDARERATVGNARHRVFFRAACLLVLALFSGQGAPLCAKDLSSNLPGGTACGGPPGGAFFWWAPEGGELWACPRCGQRDNAGWAARCFACGAAKYNPGGYLLNPAGKAPVTGGYSPGHPAVDLGAPRGSRVCAAEDGVVVEARKDRWAGNVVSMVHADGLKTLYGHLQEYRVAPGCFLRRGEVLGLAGSTGASTGPHLHFAVTLDGVPVDPLPYLGR